MDEYKTSQCCGYRQRDGKLSHSRLCCFNCASCGLARERFKQFVDRDDNAARNILWIGNPERGSPAWLVYNQSDQSVLEEHQEHRVTHLVVERPIRELGEGLQTHVYASIVFKGLTRIMKLKNVRKIFMNI